MAMAGNSKAPTLVLGTVPLRGWRDPELVATIADEMLQGVSAQAAGGRQGLSASTVATWLYRLDAEVKVALDAVDRGQAPDALSEFARAVMPIARARWDWVARMEKQAIAGEAGAQWILPRRVADIYGVKQTIDIGTASPTSEVAGLLDRIAEVRAGERG